MKKEQTYKLLLLIFSFFIYASNAFAAFDILTIQNMTKDGDKATLLCEYVDEAGTRQTEIYYIFELMDGSNTNDTKWNVFYNKTGVISNLESGFNRTNLSQGSFSYVFKKGRIYYNDYKKFIPAEKESSFTCPKYSFVKENPLGDDEICFSDNETCGDEFKRGPYKLTDNTKSIFNVIDNYAKNAYSLITYNEYKSTNIQTLIQEKTMRSTNNKYYFTSKYKSPPFISNYLNNLKVNDNDLKILQDKMNNELNNKIENGTATEEEKKIIEEKNKEKADDINISTSPVPPTNPNNDPDCAGLLGPDMTLIVQNIFKTIQYAGPILVAIFTTIDMIKAAFSGEQDDIKKAKNKFVKRLIAAICLFFIPIICNLIFGIAGITVPDTCIK